MIKKFKKVLIVTISLVFTLATFSQALAAPKVPDFVDLPEQAPEVIHYVALGDSDAAGVRAMPGELPGWEDSSKYGYTDLLAKWINKQKKITCDFNEDYCIASNTAAMLKEQTESPELQLLLSQADIVTITIGANDVIQPIYDVLYAYADGQYPTQSEFLYALAGEDGYSGAIGQSIINFGIGSELTNNIAAILTNILEVNPDAMIYVMGYFNPLPCFEDMLGEGSFAGLSGAVEGTMNAVINASISTVEAELNPLYWESIRYIDTLGVINGGYWDYAYENGYLYYEGEGEDSDYDLVPDYLMADIALTEAAYEVIAAQFEMAIAADFGLVY